MLVAMAYASLWVVRFPIIPAASFLCYDIKDVFICVGGLICEPVYCICAAVALSFLQMITLSESGIIGFAMDVLSIISFSGVVFLICRKNKSKKRLILSLCIGVISMTCAMILCNIILTPLYIGVSRETVIKMIIPALLPFNFIKSVLNSAGIYFLYTALCKVLPI